MSSSSRSARTDHDSQPPDGHAAPAVRPIGRRGFLRAGGVLAGAAGVGAVGAAAAPAAHAADGDPLVVGADHTAESTTSIRLGGGLDTTLALYNPDGPTLFLEPHAPDWQDELAIGEIVNTDLGPVLGVDTVSGPAVTYLVTAEDLEDVPTPFAAPPTRQLDTRDPARFPPLGAPAGAFDGSGRLRAGQWVDVALPPPPLKPFELAGDVFLTGAHLNVTAVGALSGGYLVVYAPGPRPFTSTLNFAAGQAVANAAFTAVTRIEAEEDDPRYAVRVYASAPVHVIVDFVGGVRQASFPLPETTTAAARRSRARAKLAARTRRLLGR